MNTFDELIIEHDSGLLNTELSREMRALIEALSKRAEEVGKAKGEITLKVKFEAAGNGMVEITTETNIKRPGPPKTRETRWIDKKGSLAAQDPRQTNLPLKTPTPQHAS